MSPQLELAPVKRYERVTGASMGGLSASFQHWPLFVAVR